MRIKRIVRKFYSILANYVRMSSKEFVEDLREGGVKIGVNVNFRYPEHTFVDMTRPSLIEIGNNVDINDNFTIMTHDYGTYVFKNLYHDFVNSSGAIKIGNNIYIGRDVTILKGVSIGDNCIIGLGSIVTKDIPSNSVAIGAPARVVCSIEDYYKKRKKLCVYEAVEYANSIYERYGRTPDYSDLTEEWTLFSSKAEYEQNSALQKNINVRIKDYLDEFFSKKKQFDGLKDFLSYCKFQQQNGE